VKVDQTQTLLQYSAAKVLTFKAPPDESRNGSPDQPQHGMCLGRYVVGAVIGLIAVVLTLELLVRYLIMGPGILFVPDPDIGKVPIKGTHVLWGTEGYGHTHYVRNGEIATLSTGGPVVVVLGDSHTEAYQVDDDAKFVSVAEKILRSHGRTVDLRNLGFSGGTMADYAQLGPAIISRYHPVAVVIQLTAADFGAESFDTTRVNHFVRAPNGSLVLMHQNVPVSSPSLGARLKHVSALVNYLQMRYLTIAERRAHGSSANHDGSSASASGAERGTIPEQINLLQRAYTGTPVIFLLLPTLPRIESGRIVMFDPAQEQLLMTLRNSLSDVSGWQIADPLPAFRQLASQGELPRGFLNTRPGTGHLNTSGHQVVGELLARAIESVRP
jgi:lysophospholipase L1-like esterase